jgi:YesN/AraC family two-component response regulator
MGEHPDPIDETGQGDANPTLLAKGVRAAPIRVVVAEDETLIRRGLELTFAGSEFHVVAMVANTDELLDAIEVHAPDLVLTDVRLPPGFTDEGLVAARRIKLRRPELGV